MSEFLKIEDGKTYLFTITCQVYYYRLSLASDKSPIKVLPVHADVPSVCSKTNYNGKQKQRNPTKQNLVGLVYKRCLR